MIRRSRIREPTYRSMSCARDRPGPTLVFKLAVAIIFSIAYLEQRTAPWLTRPTGSAAQRQWWQRTGARRQWRYPRLEGFAQRIVNSLKR